jgi:hypothetical protein
MRRNDDQMGLSLLAYGLDCVARSTSARSEVPLLLETVEAVRDRAIQMKEEDNDAE